MKFKFILYLLFLFIYTCDNPISSPNELDCIIDYKGFYDDCGVCSGGATGHIANSDKDCLNVCFGDAIKDGCGTCDNDLSNDCTTQDCNGDLNGNAFWDDCGLCVSGATGLIENNTVDDFCLVCGEMDDLRDLCSVCYGDNTSCSLGLITLSKFELTEMHLWNNSSCSGAPYYSFYNEICLEDMCYDYDLLFYKDFAGEYKFYQYNHYSQDYLLGDWTFSSELCMDYEYSCNSQDCLDSAGIPDVGTDGPSIGGDSWVEDSTVDLDECWDDVAFENSPNASYVCPILK